MDDLLQKQIEFEHAAVQRGIARYRATLTTEKADGSLKAKSLAELEPGRVIAAEVIGPLIARIEKEQLALVDPARNATGRAKFGDDHWILCAMDAEVLGAVTVLRVLSGSINGSRSQDMTWTKLAMYVGADVKHEYDFIRWKETESAAAKERDKSGVDWAPNLYKLMKARNKTVDLRVFQKWSKKSPEFMSSEWSRQVRMRLGSTLLTYLVESSGWFECAIEMRDCKKQRFLKLTDLALQWVADRHNQNELMRPVYLPMLCEPLDYCYRNPNENHQESPRLDC